MRRRPLQSSIVLATCSWCTGWGPPSSHAVLIDVPGNSLEVGGLEGLKFPVDAAPVVIDDQAAIAKAVTGAYLSSEGNAFSTRTASQIVQEHFNPARVLALERAALRRAVQLAVLARIS